MSTTKKPGGFESANIRLEPLGKSIDASAMKVAKSLASLKLTCVLFVLAMFVVFVGSLAQSRRDVWQVMGQYFRTWIAWIDIQDLFPPSMFGELGSRTVAKLGVFRYFPFPGGWLIGVVMLINLFCAHALTFKMRARGMRLLGGISLLGLGVLMTAAVVVTGNQQTGVEAGDTILSPLQIWWLLLSILGLSGLASIFSGLSLKTNSTVARSILVGLGVVLLGTLLYFIIGGEKARLNLSSMRILWQLLKGSACALVLLLGSNLLFEKRGGVVLLHFGVAMLMISELQVGLWAKENMLHLTEGETSNMVRDIRERELSIVLKQKNEKAKVVAIPEATLVKAANEAVSGSKEVNPGQIIPLPSLPFDIAVREYFQNSRLRAVTPNDQPIAKTGMGSFSVPVRLDPVTGMDEKSDSSSVAVDVIERSSGKTLQTLLVTQAASEERVKSFAEVVNVGNEEYGFLLRFKRGYRDYDVKLVDVSRRLYVGSSTPRDYRSKVEITDRKSGETEEFQIYMNNPLRYKGETFYQTSYQDLGDGKEASTISIVDNTGWMLPYIACMIVAFGMFAQFGQTLTRFLDRTERTAKMKTPLKEAPPEDGSADKLFLASRLPETGSALLPEDSRKSGSWLLPILITLVFVGWLGSKARTPKVEADTSNLYAFGQLPIVWRGRTQPFDSVARMELLMNSHKATFEGELDEKELGETKQRALILKAFQKGWPTAPSDWIADFNGSYSQWVEKIASVTTSGVNGIEERMRPVMVAKMDATRWMLDVIARPEAALRHRVIRIDNDQVLALLSLDKRPGLTYSIAEIRENMANLQADFESARTKNRNGEENSLTPRERRVMAVFNSLSRISSMQDVFNTVRFSTAGDPNLATHLVAAWDVFRRLEGEPAIMSIPTGAEGDRESWETLVGAAPVLYLNQQLDRLGIKDLEGLQTAMLTQLPMEVMPRDRVETAIRLNYPMLVQNMPGAGESPATPEAIRSAASAAADKLSLSDPGLSGVLELIANAPVEFNAEQIAQSVTEEQAQEIGRATMAAQYTIVLEQLLQKDPSSPRLVALRTKLSATGLDNKSGFNRAMIEEGSKIVWEDLQKRAKHLLPGGDQNAIFNKNAESLIGVLAAWSKQDAVDFNEQVKNYSATLAAEPLPHLNPQVVRLEAAFNNYEPFVKATYPYLTVILLTFIGWLFMEQTMRRSSLALMIVAFVIHTAALGIRMWISGRPPVTNLYSSSIFIGWSVVIAAFVLELYLKNGIGNLLGASVGASTLVMAHYLARGEGDTLAVMQAVLDTTFWLATHVVCITLGYAATFLAGFLGLLYCIQAVMGKSLSKADRHLNFSDYMKSFGKLVYGTVCFALFFSLVGTVLGGLWADDSWGRFWGWDPKENGAMMIVLWNALILHARWAKLTGDYGSSVLAMVGNVVTSWSWFGVNELGAGLHEYGFTEGRLLALTTFAVAQMLIVLACMAVSRSATSQVSRSAATT